jgi:hypothetical protein
MNEIALVDIIAILQISTAPVILISGVGLLLLSMTNRYGRVIDRVRLLVRERKMTVSSADIQMINDELAVLYRRAKIIRFSIAAAGFNILLVAFLIFLLFLFSVFDLELVFLVILTFILSLVCLIAGMVAFLLDINVSLKAVKIELRGFGPGK